VQPGAIRTQEHILVEVQEPAVGFSSLVALLISVAGEDSRADDYQPARTGVTEKLYAVENHVEDIEGFA
jgi:hypothetical protein